MLSAMRNRRGEPGLRVRLLAAVIVLLLLGPGIALLLLRGVAATVGLLY